MKILKKKLKLNLKKRGKIEEYKVMGVDVFKKFNKDKRLLENLNEKINL
jgi:hypothetical protein